MMVTPLASISISAGTCEFITMVAPGRQNGRHNFLEDFEL
jgi:hypothetical protein